MKQVFKATLLVATAFTAKNVDAECNFCCIGGENLKAVQQGSQAGVEVVEVEENATMVKETTCDEGEGEDKKDKNPASNAATSNDDDEPGVAETLDRTSGELRAAAKKAAAKKAAKDNSAFHQAKRAVFKQDPSAARKAAELAAQGVANGAAAAGGMAVSIGGKVFGTLKETWQKGGKRTGDSTQQRAEDDSQLEDAGFTSRITGSGAAATVSPMSPQVRGTTSSRINNASTAGDVLPTTAVRSTSSRTPGFPARVASTIKSKYGTAKDNIVALYGDVYADRELEFWKANFENLGNWNSGKRTLKSSPMILGTINTAGMMAASYLLCYLGLSFSPGTLTEGLSGIMMHKASLLGFGILNFAGSAYDQIQNFDSNHKLSSVTNFLNPLNNVKGISRTIGYFSLLAAANYGVLPAFEGGLYNWRFMMMQTALAGYFGSRSIMDKRENRRKNQFVNMVTFGATSQILFYGLKICSTLNAYGLLSPLISLLATGKIVYHFHDSNSAANNTTRTATNSTPRRRPRRGTLSHFENKYLTTPVDTALRFTGNTAGKFCGSVKTAGCRVYNGVTNLRCPGLRRFRNAFGGRSGVTIEEVSASTPTGLEPPQSESSIDNMEGGSSATAPQGLPAREGRVAVLRRNALNRICSTAASLASLAGDVYIVTLVLPAALVMSVPENAGEMIANARNRNGGNRVNTAATAGDKNEIEQVAEDDAEQMVDGNSNDSEDFVDDLNSDSAADREQVSEETTSSSTQSSTTITSRRRRFPLWEKFATTLSQLEKHPNCPRFSRPKVLGDVAIATMAVVAGAVAYFSLAPMFAAASTAVIPNVDPFVVQSDTTDIFTPSFTCVEQNLTAAEAANISAWPPADIVGNMPFLDHYACLVGPALAASAKNCHLFGKTPSECFAPGASASLESQLEFHREGVNRPLKFDQEEANRQFNLHQEAANRYVQDWHETQAQMNNTIPEQSSAPTTGADATFQFGAPTVDVFATNASTTNRPAAFQFGAPTVEVSATNASITNGSCVYGGGVLMTGAERGSTNNDASGNVSNVESADINGANASDGTTSAANGSSVADVDIGEIQPPRNADDAVYINGSTDEDGVCFWDAHEGEYVFPNATLPAANTSISVGASFLRAAV